MQQGSTHTTRSITHRWHAFLARLDGLRAMVPPVPDSNKPSSVATWLRVGRPAAYLTMVGLVAAAALLRLAADLLISDGRLPTFYLAVILCTWFAGVHIGLLSVALSALSAWCLVLTPNTAFALNDGQAVSLGGFVVVGVVMVFIVGSLQKANTTIEEGRRREAVQAERARAVDELRLWSDVFRNAAFGICIIDPSSGIVRFANKALAGMHGMQVDEVQGIHLLDLYAPAERVRYAKLQETAGDVGSVDLEADRIRGDGSIFPARIHISSVRMPSGERRYLVGTVQDITVERQLRFERDQSGRLEAIGQLTAGIAHDFNNLLQGIMANLELVEDDMNASPETREYASSAVRLAEQGGELTHNLLSFSRKQLLLPSEVALGDFMDRFQRLLSRTLGTRIRIDVVTEPGLAPVWVDARHLQSALLNLAINARDAMPTGGNLSIEAFDNRAAAVSAAADVDANVEGYVGQRHNGADRCVVIRVSDTGSGIAPKDLGRVCEPFFSTKGVNGTGLGLSMVHGFVKQSGGDLRITSEPGKGTCAEIRLPMAPASADAAPALMRA